MNNKQYNDQRKVKLEINERNLGKVVEYMNAQRQQITGISEEVLEWKELISKYVKIVTDLQREVEQLRNEVQVNRFSTGSSVVPATEPLSTPASVSTTASTTSSTASSSNLTSTKPKKKQLITDVTSKKKTSKKQTIKK